MRILADENVARDVVAWLRTTSHDVLFAAEERAGAPDIDWAARAEDDLTVPEILARLQAAWPVVEANPSGRFIVITESKVRVRSLPPAP